MRAIFAVSRKHLRTLGVSSIVFSTFLIGYCLYSSGSGTDALVPHFDEQKALFYQQSTCVHRAIFDLTYEEVWNQFADLTFRCEQNSKFNLSVLVPLENKDEIKYHLLARDGSKKCVILSLGVGHDIISEQQLAALQPQCRFIGADPTVKGNKELYESIGTFHPLAIGNGNKIVESLIINENDFGYQHETSQQPNFCTFCSVSSRRTSSIKCSSTLIRGI